MENRGKSRGSHAGARRLVLAGCSLAIVLAGAIASATSAAPGDVTVGLVKDINPNAANGSPRDLFDAGGTLLFAATDGSDGSELWRSDGTAAGTFMVDDDANPGGINDGSGDSNPIGFAAIGQTVFFNASDETHGRELWRIDPPYTTPLIVADINGIAGDDSDPEDLTNVNGTLFFDAVDDDGDEEMWRLPGPAYDTPVEIEANPTGSSNPGEVTSAGGTVFFVADTSGTGSDQELWKIPGPAYDSPTEIDLNPSGTSDPSDLTNVNGTLYFGAREPTDGRELWASTGPGYDASSTNMVENIFAGSTSSNPARLTAVGGTLFFEADDGIHGQELWQSTAPSDTATDVIDINPGGSTSASDPSFLADFGGTLFFSAHGPTDGIELWRSDGTPAGTILAADVNTDTPTSASNPNQLTPAGGQLFFLASGTGINNQELFKTTGIGATQVADINGNPGTSSFAGTGTGDLTEVNGAVFFGANDGVTGRELWRATIEPNPPAAIPATPAAPLPAPAPAAKKKKCKKKSHGKKSVSAAKKKKCRKKKK